MRSIVSKFAKELGVNVDELLDREAEAYELIAKHGRASSCLKELSSKYNVDIKVLITAYTLGFARGVTMDEDDIIIAKQIIGIACAIVDSLGKEAWCSLVKKATKEVEDNDSMLSSYC